MLKLILTVLFISIFSALSYSQWIYRDSNTGKYGVKDKNGAQLISSDYDDIIKLDRLDNYRATQSNEAYFYNSRGELLNRVHFDELGKFEFNAARIKQNGRYGLINEFGDITIPVVYDDLIWSLWSYAAVNKNGRWGIMTLSGNSVTPIVYDTIIAFPSSVEYALVKQNGKYGIVDMISGEITHNCNLDDYYFTGNNYIKSIKDGKAGLLHYDGTALLKPEYDDVRVEDDILYGETYFYVKSGSKWGIISERYGEVFPAGYDEISAIDKKGIVTAQKDGLEVLIDIRKGEVKNK